MKEKYTIEITLRQQLSRSFYRDCPTAGAFKKWLGVVMLLTMSKQKMAAETFHLKSISEITSFCLS